MTTIFATPAVDRILKRCAGLSSALSTGEWFECLVLAMLAEESLAAACLGKFDVCPETFSRATAENGPAETHADEDRPQVFPHQFQLLLDRAAANARRTHSSEGISSEHLLWALTQGTDTVAKNLAARGLTSAAVEHYFGFVSDTEKVDGVIAVMERLCFSDDSPAVSPRSSTPGSANIRRLLDANLNRAREGLRVLEDYARFVRNDASSTESLKRLRHRLVDAERQLTESTSPHDHNLSCRDTAGDVGTEFTTDSELRRESQADVVTANARRVQEALRSLEEFGKIVSSQFAQTMKQLRYETYELERQLGAGDSVVDNRRHRLMNSLVYVLVTEQACRKPWRQIAEEILQAGADVIQLREKQLSDRELLSRCRWLKSACAESGSLFIVNDRPDVAAVVSADGVHVGQDELSTGDARQILHSAQLVGVSTHGLAQARQAVADGADYLGVGPLFPSTTKAFENFPGLAYLREATQQITIPCFAIGGIMLENIDDVVRAGGRRVAVSSSVLAAEFPGDAVRELRCKLMAASVERGVSAFE